MCQTSSLSHIVVAVGVWMESAVLFIVITHVTIFEGIHSTYLTLPFLFTYQLDMNGCEAVIGNVRLW